MASSSASSSRQPEHPVFVPRLDFPTNYPSGGDSVGSRSVIFQHRSGEPIHIFIDSSTPSRRAILHDITVSRSLPFLFVKAVYAMMRRGTEILDVVEEGGRQRRARGWLSQSFCPCCSCERFRMLTFYRETAVRSSAQRWKPRSSSGRAQALVPSSSSSAIRRG